jgi:glycosyltransferase involved in cell wall biosynthesis
MGWPEIASEFYRLGTQMEGACLRLADGVFSSSACSAEWCARHYGLVRAEIPILHTGVDTQLFSPRPVPKSKRPTIVFVGKLVRNKGVHLLLEAACRLAREFPDLQLRLIGRGEPAVVNQLRQCAQANGRSEMLELTGFVPRTELPEHLSRAHVFASPSQYEGGPGFVWLEAMACGLPVVACSGSGASEVIQDGETGLLVPPQDVDTLTETLRSLLCHAEYRQRLGDSARKYVLEQADSRACLKKLEEFYCSVARSKRSSSA